MRLSVIVSTYNRVEGLRRTLEALRYQTHDDFEVVVVNGPSTDKTEEFLQQLDDVRVVQCPLARLSASRNLGIAASAGEVLAFIDDDALPESPWLAELDAAYADDRVAGAGGIVFNHTGVALQYRYSVHGRSGHPDFRQRRPLDRFLQPGADPFLYLQGTNMSFRRRRLVEVGGFDEGIEYNHDDVEVCLELIDRGYRLVPLDGAAVHHRYLPSHFRNEGRRVFDPYKPVKDRAYFAVQHGRATRSLEAVLKDIADYAEEVRTGGRWDHAHGYLTGEQLAYFLARIDEAVEAGQRQGLEGERTRQHLPDPDPGVFKRFRAHRPPEGRFMICLLSYEFPPEDFGGVGRYTADLAAGLADRGHETHVITHSAELPHVDFEGGVWIHRDPAPDFQVAELLGQPVSGNLYLTSADYYEVAALTERIPVDLVLSPLWLCEGALCQLDLRFPTVFTLQTVHKTIAKILESWRGNERIAARVALEDATLSRAKYLHANSHASLETVQGEFQLPTEVEVRVVPHGLRDRRAEFPVPEREPGRVDLLFTGRLERRKGVDVLLQAAPTLLEEFPNLHLTLVGKDTRNTDLPTTYRESFNAASAGRPDLAARVHFTGALPDAELFPLYAACDIFCAPSRYESFGLVFLEAMMFAKPVVGCAAGGMSEIIEPGGNGFLAEPGDCESLLQCLRRLIADRELRQRFGGRSRELFEQRYSLDVVARQMAEAFRGAALEGRQGRGELDREALIERTTAFVAELTPLNQEKARAAATALVARPELRSPYVSAIRRFWTHPPEEFVERLYQLLFRREADPDGRAVYSAALRSGMTRAALVRRLATSAEGWQHLGEADWLPALDSFETRDRLRSIEAAWPAPAATFVRVLYQSVLSREPDVRGLWQHLASLQRGRSRLDLLQAFAVSREAQSRNGDPKWLTQLEEQRAAAAADPRLEQMQEALQRSDEEFVHAAYRLVLCREPDPEGRDVMLRRLQFGLRREQLLYLMATSEEATFHGLDVTFLLGLTGPAPGNLERVAAVGLAAGRRTLPPRARRQLRTLSHRLLRRAAREYRKRRRPVRA